MEEYFSVVVPQNPDEPLEPGKSVIATKRYDDGKILDLCLKPGTKQEWVEILRFRDRAQGWIRLSHLELPGYPVGYPFIAARAIGPELVSVVTGKVDSIKKDTLGKIVERRIGRNRVEELKIQTDSCVCWVRSHFITPGTRLVGDVISVVSSLPHWRGSSEDRSIWWIRIYDQERDMLIFRQSGPVQVWWSGEGKYEIPMLLGLGPFFLPEIKKLGLEVGSYVYPVVEITATSVRHPRCWARIPEVGPFTDWKTTQDLAIKIQWKAPNQKWKETYLSSRRQLRFHKHDFTALEDYVTASALYRYLLNRTSTGIWGTFNEPLKLPPRTRRLEFTYFDQKLQVIESYQFADTISGPSHIGEKWTRDKLRKRKPHRVGGKRGLVDLSYHADGKIREICDACVYTEETCVPAGGTTNCTACDMFLRPCTWTKLDDLQTNEPLRRALTFPPANPNVAEDIDTPLFLDMYECFMQGKYPVEVAKK